MEKKLNKYMKTLVLMSLMVLSSISYAENLENLVVSSVDYSKPDKTKKECYNPNVPCTPEPSIIYLVVLGIGLMLFKGHRKLHSR